MRLTLRTLLAYRDRVLNPAELHDLHARVQQSAMAGNLLKRIDALSQRTNILAPPIDGKGLGADANSIAEYLDDSLTGDKVPELERICLESDVQLAELSHCHDLLSTALSTPVEVSDALRQRIVGWRDKTMREQALAERPTGLTIEPETRAAVSRAIARETELDSTAAAEKSSRHDGKAHSRIDLAHRPVSDNGSDGKALVPSHPVEAPMVASGGDSIKPTGLDLEGSHLAHEVPEYLRGRSRDGWRGPLAIGGLVAVLCLLAWQSIGSWSIVQEMFVAAPLTNSETKNDSGQPLQPNAAQPNAAQPNAVQPNPAQPNAAQPNAAGGNDTQRSGVEPKSDDSGNGAQANPATAVTPPATDTISAAAQWLPTDADAMQAVLFAQASGSQPVHRVQPAERLPSASQIFVPATSRPTLDIVGGPRWQAAGLTHMLVAIADTKPASPPMVELRLGRAILTPSPSASMVQINTPDSQLLIDLADASSKLAIDLTYLPVARAPVTDRSAHPPVLVAYTIEGSATLQLLTSGAPTNSLTLAKGQMIFITRGTVTAPQATEPPSWIDPASDRPVDQAALQDIGRQLSETEAIGATLQKLATGRRPETRALAAQTLALMGAWDWVVAPKSTLGDARDRSYWFGLLDATRQLLAANPSNAASLQSTLATQEPDIGAFRAQMWLGFTQAQLEGDALAKTIDLLDSESLLDRILAIYTLQRLTGKDLGYQAGEANRAAIQQWNREIASGRLQLLPLGNKP